jgi:uncharacterized membrane protein YoaK (UPF0700 family)
MVEKVKKGMSKFFDNPYRFSFKDLIAIIFVGLFIYVTIKALGDKQALEVMQVLIPIIMVILGGYFVHENVSAYFMSKSNNPYGNTYGNMYGSMYGGYGYDPYNTMGQQNNVAQQQTTNTTEITIPIVQQTQSEYEQEP